MAKVMKNAKVKQAVAAIRGSRFTLALSGAGISVESGIPDFRSTGGLWSKYAPSEYATIEAFRQSPEKVWEMLFEMNHLLARAKPNPAHCGLAVLEKMGLLHHVITQNVDNLHQAAGSIKVIEYHGNAATLVCPSCGAGYRLAAVGSQRLPRCSCGQILKPEVIFFGEEIPPVILERSRDLASLAEVLLVVGTSAEVAPANMIPLIAKEHGAVIIEINREPSRLTDSLTDIFLPGKAGAIVPVLVAELES